MKIKFLSLCLMVSTFAFGTYAKAQVSNTETSTNKEQQSMGSTSVPTNPSEEPMPLPKSPTDDQSTTAQAGSNDGQAAAPSYNQQPSTSGTSGNAQ